QVFLRPVGVRKLFTGRCVDRRGVTLALESARDAGGTVLVAVPRPISEGGRLVVVRDHVVAASQYRSEGRLAVQADCPAEVRSFADAILAEAQWRPDPIYVMDVCQSENQLRLVELNSFSCSGLYRCDPRMVVEAVKDLALEQWQRVHSAVGGG